MEKRASPSLSSLSSFLSLAFYTRKTRREKEDLSFLIHTTAPASMIFFLLLMSEREWWWWSCPGKSYEEKDSPMIERERENVRVERRSEFSFQQLHQLLIMILPRLSFLFFLWFRGLCLASHTRRTYHSLFKIEWDKVRNLSLPLFTLSFLPSERDLQHQALILHSFKHPTIAFLLWITRERETLHRLYPEKMMETCISSSDDLESIERKAINIFLEIADGQWSTDRGERFKMDKHLPLKRNATAIHRNTMHSIMQHKSWSTA